MMKGNNVYSSCRLPLLLPLLLLLLVSSPGSAFSLIHPTNTVRSSTFGIRIDIHTPPSSSSLWLSSSSSNNDDEEEEDDLLDFDPRVSPMAYSNNDKKTTSSGTGSMDITSSVAKSVEDKPKKSMKDDDTSSSSPPLLLTLNDDVLSCIEEEEEEDVTPAATKEEDPFAGFDPRVSPHMYPNGIPTTVNNTSTTTSSSQYNYKIGIVLIDHGSKREESNLLLETMATLYQRRSPNHFVVRAAHMEIASPSISDVIADLVLRQNIDRIVCHPYFLSPGRHVTKDIPVLVQEARDEIEKELGTTNGNNYTRRNVQIVTTEHTGSRTNIMLDAITDSVETSIKMNLGGTTDDDMNNSGGMGFFGDIMRMMEEVQES